MPAVGVGCALSASSPDAPRFEEREPPRMEFFDPGRRCSRIELLVYEIANDGEAGDPYETLALCGHQVRTISERLYRCTLDRKHYVKIACRWPAAAATAQDGPSPRGWPAEHASLSVGS